MHRNQVARVGAKLPLACAVAIALAGCNLVAVSGYRDEVLTARRASAPGTPVAGEKEITEEASAPLDPGPLAIGIAEAVLLSLEQNPGFALKRLAPSRVATTETEAASAFDPSVAADFTDPRTVDTLTGTRSGARTTSVEASVALPAGTQIAFEVAHIVAASGPLPDAAWAAVSVRQPLLRGGRPRANLAVLRQAGLDVRSSEYELRGAAESLIADVETAYWEHGLAKERIAIFEESLRLAEQQRDETRIRIKAGKLAGTELAAARAEVASRADDLIGARGALEIARIRLLQLLGPPGGGSVRGGAASFWSREVTALDRPEAPAAGPGDVEEHVANAIANRPDLNQARLAIERGDLELVRTRNGLLPRLDVFVSFGRTGFADSFSDALGNLSDSRDVSTGLVFEYPLGNRGARARQRRAQISSAEAALALENLAQLAQVDVRTAHVIARTTWKRITATAAARALQEEAFRAETEKFRVGKSTTFQVAQAQRDLVSSKLAEVEAVVGYLQALVALYRADGSLLERRGVSAPGVPRK